MDSGIQSQPIERRTSGRHKLITVGWFFPDSGEGPFKVTLRDISLHGVGFESEAAVEPGALGRLRIDAGAMQVSWRLTVVFCGKIQDGDYRVGGALLPVDAGTDGAEQGLDPSDVLPMLILQ